MRAYDKKPRRAHRTARGSEHDTTAVDGAAAGQAVALRRPDILTPARILQLQRRAGNAAVARMLQEEHPSDSDFVGKGGGTALDPGTTSVQRDTGANVAGAAPHSQRRPSLSFKRAAESSAVQSLFKTTTPRASGVVVQRLAWNSMVLRNDVASVKNVGGKSAFILTGTDGTKVVVKFESTREAPEIMKARYRTTMNIAKKILPNVPSYDFISKVELQELINLPPSVTGDADLLRSYARDSGVNGGPVNDLPVRLSFVDVGQNLEDMLQNAAPAMPGAPARPQNIPQLGLPRKTAAMQLLQDNPVVWRQLGRMAAFDLFIGQADRFNPNGYVNVQNLDFNSAGTQAVALDNFDPFARMDNIVANYKVQKGKSVVDIPDALKTKAQAKKYADSAVTQLCQQVGIVVVSDDFYDGFNAARKELRQKLLKAIDQGKKQSKRDEEPERIEYLNFLRARVKLIVV